MIHPTKGKGRWIMVAVETSRQSADRASSSVVEVWNIEDGSLVETFVTRTASVQGAEVIQEPEEVIGVEAEASPAVAMAALVRSIEANSTGNERRDSRSGDGFIPPPAPDVRAMVVGPDFGGYSGLHRLELGDLGDFGTRSAARGFMITGSEDKMIRLWDLSKLERTSILSGLEEEHERPTYRCVIGIAKCAQYLTSLRLSSITSGNAATYVETWASPSSQNTNRPPQRISLVSHNQQTLLRSHQDIITALACFDSPFRGGIVSGDRAGVIKVWRAEGAD